MSDFRQAIAGVFDRAAQTYDAVGVEFFSTIGRTLVDDASLQPGECVLDVGCGRGAVLFPAADKVGPQGSVCGIDLARAMVELTQREVKERGLSHVATLVMDAQEPQLPESSFDVALASLVIFFLPDPAKGLTAWRDALVPGGRLGLTTFDGDDTRWGWIEELFAPFKPAALQRIQQAGGDGPFSTTANLEKVLIDTGFAEPVTVVREQLTRFEGADQWVAWSWSHGQRALWEFVPDGQRDAVEAQARKHLALLADNDGTIVLRQNIRYTLARRPLG